MTYQITVVRHNVHPDSVYIGRGSIFGNPAPITPTDTRNKVCDYYEQYFIERIQNDPLFFNAVKALHQQGMQQGYLKLGCFCTPHRCHGDTIKRFMDDNRDLFLDPF